MSIPSDYTPLQANYNGDRVTLKVGDIELSDLKFKKVTKNVFQKIKDSFSNDYVSLKIGKTTIKVSTDDLAKALGTSRETIIKTNKKMLLSPEWLNSMMYAKEKQASLEDFLLKQQGLRLPNVHTVEEADTEAIKDFSKQMNDIYRIAHLIMKKPGFDPNKEEQMTIPLTAGGREFIISATLKGTDLQIHSLFGKKLGSGSFGEAILRIDLMTMQWSTDPTAVAKVSIGSTDQDNQAILFGINTVNKLNPNGNVLGMQKPIREMKIRGGIKLNREELTDKQLQSMEKERLIYVGPKYMGDGQQIAYSLGAQDRLSITYQLFHGLTHAHVNHFSNCDLKSENTFIDSEIGARLFVSDWDTSLDHTDPLAAYNQLPDPKSGMIGVHTPLFRFMQDDQERLKYRNLYKGPIDTLTKMMSIIRETRNIDAAFREIKGKKPNEIAVTDATLGLLKKEGEKYTDEEINQIHDELLEDYKNALAEFNDTIEYIEQRADVTGACLVACEFLTNGFPKINGMHSVYKEGLTIEELVPHLKKIGLSNDTIALLKAGLNPDYELRPEAHEIMHALKKDIDRLYPDLGTALAKRSLY